MPEIDRVVRKKPVSSSKAPGPDGFRATMWKQVTDEMLEWMRHLFNTCLIKGDFSDAWKRANLALIPKEKKANRMEPRLPKVRPICLLDEIGKAFERIIVERIQMWQMEHPESDFSEYQFGFRRHRSTSDALQLVRDITLSAVRNRGYAIVFSLDIRNAFNSIPWPVINRALRHKEFPTYIRRIIDSYLSNRIGTWAKTGFITRDLWKLECLRALY